MVPILGVDVIEDNEKYHHYGFIEHWVRECPRLKNNSHNNIINYPGLVTKRNLIYRLSNENS